MDNVKPFACKAFEEAIYKSDVQQYVSLINRMLQLNLSECQVGDRLIVIPRYKIKMREKIMVLNKQINKIRGFWVTLNFNPHLIEDITVHDLLKKVMDFVESKTANKNAKMYYYLSIEQRGVSLERQIQMLNDGIEDVSKLSSEDSKKLKQGSGIHFHMWLSKSNEKQRIKTALWNKFYKYIGIDDSKIGINNSNLFNFKEIGGEFFDDKKKYLEGMKEGSDKMFKVEADILWRKDMKLETIYTNFDENFNPGKA